MRFILALSLSVGLYGSANAATVHSADRGHIMVRPNHSLIHSPRRPAVHHRAARYDNYREPYFGASQGYAPGEKERFLESVMSPY